MTRVVAVYPPLISLACWLVPLAHNFFSERYISHFFTRSYHSDMKVCTEHVATALKKIIS